MRWLHLSDLHVGNPSAQQQTALASLVAAIAQASASMKIDGVLISGDLAFSGQADEYKLFDQLVLTPLLALTAFDRAKVFAVPGNHDIECAQVDPIQWMGIGGERQKRYFDEDQHGARVRQPRARGFAPYSAFVRDGRVFSPRPDEEVSAQHLIDAEDVRLQVVCTNTAFFSDKDPTVREYEFLPAPTASIRHRLLVVPDCDVRLVVGHHPIEWFLHEHRESFKSMLVQNNAVYLHGHEHDIRARFGGEGILSIGFGAAYQDKQDPDPANRNWYRNSFAIFELADAFHVVFYEWDPKNGRWVMATSLPSEFQKPSHILSGGYALSMARSRLNASKQPTQRPTPQPRQICALGNLSVADWQAVITQGHLVDQRDLEPGALQHAPNENPVTLVYQTTSGRHMIRCIQSRSETISKTQVESWNNTIDYNSLQSLTVVSFGTITEDANTSYLRLRARKPLRILLGDEVAKVLGRVLPSAQVARMSTFDGRNVDASILAFEGILLVLLREKNDAWFEIVGPDGQVVDAAHPAVRETRAVETELSRADYCPDRADVTEASTTSATAREFDRAAYLSRCHAEFNSARYTALAAIGIRLPDLPLDALYVQATAESGEQAGRRATLSRSIDDMLDRLGLKGALRYQLETEMKRAYGLASAPETSGARLLYQEYGAICVQGDPGSGKTCFAKSELLAYCRPPGTEAAWYAKHVPVYVPLSAVIRRQDGEVDILRAAIDSATTRGLPLRRQDLERLLKSGEVAFFFDGLDEVVSVEARSKVVAQIATLLEVGLASGNRFVVTTRPAAAQVVELPSQLKDIHLCGLSSEEQRALAGRVLRARVAEEAGEIAFAQTQLSIKDEAVVTQIVQDVAQSAGLRRLATNPLFLTLLVFIGANSGRPSARRHGSMPRPFVRLRSCVVVWPDTT
ncbi:MAG: metallophosphoesterase [Myxococcales bacterium]|nr:metallophosphoesterase [Myxococcales bacterium]